MNAVLVNGWGIESSVARRAVDSCEAFESVAIVQPVRNWKELLASFEGKADVVIAYSIGACFLLGEPELARAFERRVLLAPIFDTGSGAALGREELGSWVKCVSEDPLAAIECFYARANLAYEKPSDLPVSPVDLRWGLEHVLNQSSASKALDDFEILAGSDDRVVDGAWLQRQSSSARLLAGVGHDLKSLLFAWRHRLQRG